MLSCLHGTEVAKGTATSGWIPARWPRLGRLLVVILITMDTLRRMLGNDVRPVDVWMLVIEAFVLLLILLDFLWHGKDRFVAWQERRIYKQEIFQKLESLGSDEADALRIMILQDRRPAKESIILVLAQPPELIEKHPLAGWRIMRQHKHLLRKWAKTK